MSASTVVVVLVVLLAAGVDAESAPNVVDDIPETILRPREELIEPTPDPRMQGVTITPNSEYLWASTEAIDRLGPEILFAGGFWMKKQLAAAPDSAPCVEMGVAIPNMRASYRVRDLDEMVEVSETIVEGTVKGFRVGYYRHSIGSLLAVEIAAVHAHEGRSPPPEGVLLVFYPAAPTFEVLGRRVCAHGEHGFPAPPAPGDRMLILSAREALDPGGAPVALYNENFVVERADGSLVIPRKLLRDATLARARDLAAVRAEILKRRSDLF